MSVDKAASLGPFPIAISTAAEPFVLPAGDGGVAPVKGQAAMKQDMRLKASGIGPDGVGSPFLTRTNGPGGVRVNTLPDELGQPDAKVLRVVGSHGDTKFTVTGTPTGLNGSSTTPVGKNVTVNGSLGVNPNQNAGIGVDPTPVTLGGRVTLAEGPLGVYAEGRTDQLNQIKSGSNRTEVGLIYNPQGPAGSDDSSRGLVGITAGVTTVEATNKNGRQTSNETIFVRANTNIGPVGVDAHLNIPSSGSPASGGVTFFGGDSTKGGSLSGGGSVSATGETIVWMGYVNNNLR